MVGVALILFTTHASGGEPAPGAVASILPDAGRVEERGNRIEMFDGQSKRDGYDSLRQDGLVDLFNLDETRRETIAPQPSNRRGSLRCRSARRGPQEIPGSTIEAAP